MSTCVLKWIDGDAWTHVCMTPYVDHNAPAIRIQPTGSVEDGQQQVTSSSLAFHSIVGPKSAFTFRIKPLEVVSNSIGNLSLFAGGARCKTSPGIFAQNLSLKALHLPHIHALGGAGGTFSPSGIPQHPKIASRASEGLSLRPKLCWIRRVGPETG